MDRIISAQKSVIVAADVPHIQSLAKLVEAVTGVPGIGGFKTGMTLGMKDLGAAVAAIKQRMGWDMPVIHDHQKGGNDIPEMGKQFASALKTAGVDAAILFPFTGPVTQEAWTKSCFDAGLQVITGGVMTHAQFLQSEGGYIADASVERIYRRACRLGVRHFVVPGNKIAWVKAVRSILLDELGNELFVLYAPGFITQGGSISECGLAAGDEWHAIVGSAIYNKPDHDSKRAAAFAAVSQLP